MNEVITNTGLYVTFNRLNKELNLFENRFYAITRKKSDNPEIQKELNQRMYAELWVYYSNLLEHINSKIEDLETKMLENFPDTLESALQLQYIPILELQKKVIYYPENEVFQIEDMSVTDINKETNFIKEV